MMDSVPGRVVTVAVLSLVLHLLLGWTVTGLAALAVGASGRSKAALVGALGLLLGWAVPVAYSFVVAPGPTARMLSTVGALIGNVPGALVVGLTLCIGGVLGALAGHIGFLAHGLLTPRSA